MRLTRPRGRKPGREGGGGGGWICTENTEEEEEEEERALIWKTGWGRREAGCARGAFRAKFRRLGTSFRPNSFLHPAFLNRTQFVGHTYHVNQTILRVAYTPVLDTLPFLLGPHNRASYQAVQVRVARNRASVRPLGGRRWLYDFCTKKPARYIYIDRAFSLPRLFLLPIRLLEGMGWIEKFFFSLYRIIKSLETYVSFLVLFSLFFSFLMCSRKMIS